MSQKKYGECSTLLRMPNWRWQYKQKIEFPTNAIEANKLNFDLNKKQVMHYAWKSILNLFFFLDTVSSYGIPSYCTVLFASHYKFIQINSFHSTDAVLLHWRNHRFMLLHKHLPSLLFRTMYLNYTPTENMRKCNEMNTERNPFWGKLPQINMHNGFHNGNGAE